MEKEREKLLDELLNQIDRAYDLMEEYDSMSEKIWGGDFISG